MCVQREGPSAVSMGKDKMHTHTGYSLHVLDQCHGVCEKLNSLLFMHANNTTNMTYLRVMSQLSNHDAEYGSPRVYSPPARLQATPNPIATIHNVCIPIFLFIHLTLYLFNP